MINHPMCMACGDTGLTYQGNTCTCPKGTALQSMMNYHPPVTYVPNAIPTAGTGQSVTLDLQMLEDIKIILKLAQSMQDEQAKAQKEPEPAIEDGYESEWDLT